MKPTILIFTRAAAILAALIIVSLGFYWSLLWAFIGGIIDCYTAIQTTWVSVQFMTGFAKIMCSGTIAIGCIYAVSLLIKLVDRVEAWRWSRT